MKRPVNDISKKATIVNALGLHARSAAKIAEVARGAKSPVWICKGDDCADAADILDLISLLCPTGTELIIRIEDATDAAVLAAIYDLIASGFGESTQNE